MGMAILPARLKTELGDIADLIKQTMNEVADDGKAVESICSTVRSNEKLAPHEEWVRSILSEDFAALRSKVSSDDGAITALIKQEVGTVFSHVLENAGVYKMTDEGKAGFMRFIDIL
jgi:UDPglucose--hexose-1-phosphate uridylyltransferase